MSDEPTPPTLEEIRRAQLTKRKTKAWEHAPRPAYHFDATVKVREHWEAFYVHLSELLDTFFLDNPMRDLLYELRRDGTTRTNAKVDEFLGTYDSTGSYSHAGSTAIKALPRVRKLLDEQYLEGVAINAVLALTYAWQVSAFRRGDQTGWYPNDHDIQFGCRGPSDIPGIVDRAGDAIFATFVRTLREFTPVCGFVTMAAFERSRTVEFDRDNGYFDTVPDREPFTAGYHWGLFIPNADVDTLGGHDHVAATAPVDEIIPVAPFDGSPGPGIAVRLTSKVSQLTDERLTEWREFLDPVIDMKPTTQVRPRLDRPVDVLDNDWSATPVFTNDADQD